MMRRSGLTWIAMAMAFGLFQSSSTSYARYLDHARIAYTTMDVDQRVVHGGTDTPVSMDNKDLWLAVLMHTAETAPLAVRFAGLN